MEIWSITRTKKTDTVFIASETSFNFLITVSNYNKNLKNENLLKA